MKRVGIGVLFSFFVLVAVSVVPAQAATHYGFGYYDPAGQRVQMGAAGYKLGDVAFSGYMQFNHPLHDDKWMYLSKVRAAYMPFKFDAISTAFGLEHEVESASKPPVVNRLTLAVQIGFVKLRYADAGVSSNHIPQYSVHVNKKFSVGGLNARISGEGTRDYVPKKPAVNGATLYLAVDIPGVKGASVMTGFRKKWNGDAGPGSLPPVLGIRYDF